MVETNLTEKLIEAGDSLIKRLDEGGFKSDATFWFYFSEIKLWKLVIAENTASKNGPKIVYQQIQITLKKHSKELEVISLSNIVLVESDAPLINLLRKAVKTGPGINRVRLTNNVINGTLIEDALIYRI